MCGRSLRLPAVGGVRQENEGPQASLRGEGRLETKRGTNEVPEVRVCLKRAFIILRGVEKDLEGWRAHLRTMAQSIEETPGFGEAMIKGIAGRFSARREKGELSTNLDLASRELETASRLDRDSCTVLEVEEGRFNREVLEAMVDVFRGDLEFTSRNIQGAIRYYEESAGKIELPDTFFNLGAAYECEFQPAKALEAFEKCMRLEPDTELAVEALRRIERLRNYRKRFRGSWLVLYILIGLFFPAAPFYYWSKLK